MPSSKRFPFHQFLWPQFWPTWIALGFLRLVVILPRRWQLRVGRGLGRLLCALPIKPKRVAQTNLRLCFPELDAQQRKQLLHTHYHNLGIGMVEMAVSWWGRDPWLQSLAQVEGLEHLDAALARGKGAILLSAHFTTLEIGGRLLSLHRPFAVMYRHQSDRLFNEVMRRARERNYQRVIHRNDVRGFLRTLRDGMAVWYAPDQNYAGPQSVFVPFCGLPAATNTATARLARTSGAPIVPFFPERLADGRYNLRILPALEAFTGEDVTAETARINEVIEQQVRRIPAQYFWVHRRFKNRPAGEPRYY